MSDHRTVIEAGKNTGRYFKDIWSYRGLFYFLAWRDILVRYKQTVIGIAWSIIRPLITLIVFTLVFGKLAGMPSDGVPYALMVCAGIIPWQFFSNAFSEGSLSLIGNSALISKVYFPRIIVPVSSVIVALIDFFISLLILGGLMIWYNFIPGPSLLLLPVFLLMALIVSIGSALFVSALNVKYRDFRYIVPFIVQFGLYISPVGFNSTVIPSQYKLLYYLNPMAGVIDGFRYSLLGNTQVIYPEGMMVSLAVTVIILITGITYFRNAEKKFADII